MVKLNRNAKAEAERVIVTLTRCYRALSREQAPTTELRRYLDRIQSIADRAGIVLTPTLRARYLELAARESRARGSDMDLHTP